jgi:hypothetical protein
MAQTTSFVHSTRFEGANETASANWKMSTKMPKQLN